MRTYQNRIVFLLFVFATTLTGIAAQNTAATDHIRPKVDEYMNARLAVKNAGGAVLIARDGQLIVNKGFGIADVGANTPISAETKFRIGSITKQFTAAAILLLHEEGKLNVDSPFCNYMESCPDAWKPVTVRNLATMSSGIPSFTGLPEFRELRKKDMKPAESIALVSHLPLKAKPGDVFEYSNTNYIILGMIIEKVSGRSYEDFLAERITKPLGLKNTGYDHGKERLNLSALGYSLKDDEVVPAERASMMVPFSAGALYSTTGDLYKWNVALHGGKLYKKPETLALMLTPSQNNYAFGVNVVTDAKGRKRVSHGGAIEGFLSDAAYYPTEKLFMAILVNNDRVPASDVLRTLTAIYDGTPYTLPKKRIAVKVDAAILDKYVGEYELTPTVKFKFSREGEGLVLEPTGQSKAPVFAESETDFFLKVVDATFKFVKDDSGNVTGIEFTQAGRTSKMRRL